MDVGSCPPKKDGSDGVGYESTKQIGSEQKDVGVWELSNYRSEFIL